MAIINQSIKLFTSHMLCQASPQEAITDSADATNSSDQVQNKRTRKEKYPEFKEIFTKAVQEVSKNSSSSITSKDICLLYDDLNKKNKHDVNSRVAQQMGLTIQQIYKHYTNCFAKNKYELLSPETKNLVEILSKLEAVRGLKRLVEAPDAMQRLDAIINQNLSPDKPLITPQTMPFQEHLKAVTNQLKQKCIKVFVPGVQAMASKKIYREANSFLSNAIEDCIDISNVKDTLQQLIEQHLSTLEKKVSSLIVSLQNNNDLLQLQYLNNMPVPDLRFFNRKIDYDDQYVSNNEFIRQHVIKSTNNSIFDN